MPRGFPPAQGLYDGRHEHDSCGVAFVATLAGRPGHEIVDQALAALRNMEHRGASGSEADSGDGAGILLQVPDAFLRAVTGLELPAAGGYVVGMAFLPVDPGARAAAEAAVERLAVEEGFAVLGWRDVPVVADMLGATARAAMPVCRQFFATPASPTVDGPDPMAIE